MVIPNAAAILYEKFRPQSKTIYMKFMPKAHACLESAISIHHLLSFINAHTCHQTPKTLFDPRMMCVSLQVFRIETNEKILKANRHIHCFVYSFTNTNDVSIVFIYTECILWCRSCFYICMFLCQSCFNITHYCMRSWV